MCIQQSALHYSYPWEHITPGNSTTESVVISVLFWCNSAPLCLTLSHITSRLLVAPSTAVCQNIVSSSKTTDCNHTVHIHGVCIHIYIHTIEEKDQAFLSPTPSPLQVFSNLTHGFPFTLLEDVEFLLRLSRDDRMPRGLNGRAGACAMRTMRGERHTLMVESSLADSSNSWSAGLNATEFTTSSCARRARQML